MKLKTIIGYSIFIMLMHGQAQASFDLVEDEDAMSKGISLGLNEYDAQWYAGRPFYLTNSDGLRYFKQPVVLSEFNHVFLDEVNTVYQLNSNSLEPLGINPKFIREDYVFVFEDNNGIQPRAYFALKKGWNETTSSYHWVSKLCVNTTDYRYAPTSPEEAVDQTPFEWAEAFLCRITEGERQSEAKDNKNDIVGDDMRLSVDYIIDGKQVKGAELIALGVGYSRRELYSTFINMDHVGCLNQCNLNSDSNSYVGRIDKQDIVIVSLKYEGERVTGTYQRKNITGKKTGNTMTLSVLDDEGAVSATLTGTLDDGIYSGTWHSTQTEQTLPFTMYMRPY